MVDDFNIKRLKTSWTKYDVVQVMRAIDSKETLLNYINKKTNIDEPILRSFLGMKSLKDPIPDYWIDIQNYPKEKSLFALLAVIFTHWDVIQKFANEYSTSNMKGVFKMQEGKQFTNIRRALIESGAAAPYLSRDQEVPYDFSPIYQNLKVGNLFKQVLIERITRVKGKVESDENFFKICYENNFHKTLSLSKSEFKFWIQGTNAKDINYINEVHISNFFSVENVHLSEIGGAKEVYFLGENGDGKSLILMAIYLAFNRHFISDETEKEETGKVVDILKSNKSSNISGIDSKNRQFGETSFGYFSNLFAYGTHRGRYSTDDAELYGFMSLFDSNQTLTNPISWLRDQYLLDLEKKLDSKNMVGEDKDLPGSFSAKLLENMFYELLEKNVVIKIEGNGISFIEKGTSLNFDQLSEGYKSIIIFVSDLLFRLQKDQPETNRVEDLYGVVLVDEIDLHLHPKWQRVIIKKLRTLLPRVQFMFTTHSPTIIQGASDDAVIYRVYRNSNDGKTRVSDPYFRKDLNHLMINTLLTSPLFGLENSRLDSENDYADTSDTYLLYRINLKLEKELERQKEEGKEFVSDSDIDKLIKQIIDEELGKNDQN